MNQVVKCSELTLSSPLDVACRPFILGNGSSASLSSAFRPPIPNVALLTGGSDKPYVLGIATALSSARVAVDLIGSDELDVAELHKLPELRFLNLRGDQSQEARFRRKIARVARYYWRLIEYAATARPRIFHVLWNNKFEFVDRVLLMAY